MLVNLTLPKESSEDEHAMKDSTVYSTVIAQYSQDTTGLNMSILIYRKMTTSLAMLA